MVLVRSWQSLPSIEGATFLISRLLERLAKASRKNVVRPIAAARGWFLWCEAKATVRVARDRVNTQELCKREILLRGFTRRNADQGSVELGWAERLATGFRA
jgi:hypothetical protein